MKKIAVILFSTILTLLTTHTNADVVGNPEKIPGWVIVYQTDDLGATTRGNLVKLVNAVKSGADIKVAIGGATSYRLCSHTSIFTIVTDEHVGCQVNTSVALLSSVNPPVMRPTPYRTYSWFDTTGNYALARASIYGGANLGQSVITNRFDTIWFARIR
ncbi:MAG: hypothetical protein GY951_14000 [Psychromonas sp.]|nr:hypothetical protein [Psychromonas sp.]